MNNTAWALLHIMSFGFLVSIISHFEIVNSIVVVPAIVLFMVLASNDYSWKQTFRQRNVVEGHHCLFCSDIDKRLDNTDKMMREWDD